MTAAHQASPPTPPSRDSLRVLHLESSDADSAAVRRYLERQGLGVHIVCAHAREDFLAHLTGEFDIVLTGDSVPGFDSCEALRLVREHRPELPFLIVSGMISEEEAVGSIKSGAADYVWKAAIESALRERRHQADLQSQHEAKLPRSQESLSQSETWLRAIFEGSLDVILLADDDARYVDANPAASALLGYSHEEFLQIGVADVLAVPSDQGFRERWASFLKRGSDSREFVLYRKGGTAVEVEQRASFNVLPGLHLTILRDITGRKAAEAALAESARQNAEILESINDGFFALDADWRFTYANAQAGIFLEREPEHLIGKVVWDEFPDAVATPFETHYRRAVETGCAEAFQAYYPPPLDAHYAVRAFPFKDGLSVYFRDVTEEKLAETALRESKRQFVQITDAMPQLVWTTGPTGYHDYFNERWYVYTGMARPAEPGGEVGQFDWDAYLHPDDVEETTARWANSLATGEPYETEYRFRCAADGEYRWFIGRAMPVRDETGAVVRWFGTCTDIHDLRVAEEEVRKSEERLRLVSHATNDAVWDWDMKTDRFVANPAFGDLFGWRDEAGAGFDNAWMVERMHPDDRALAFETFRAIMAGEEATWSSEHRFERADGTWADVLERGYIVRENGVPVRTIGAMLDLSARKATERALVEAKEAAEEVARAKSSLLMNMSHEIRTPLTAVIGYAEMLAAEMLAAETFAADAPADLMNLVEPIERGGKRLLETLNSVLDLAQIEAGALALAAVTVDLRAEADAAASALERLAQAKGLALVLTGPPTAALADRAALARVLTNLVGNAVKFTERGTIAVDVWAENGSALARVTDTGVGIDAEFLPHVFEDFKQESSGDNRSHEGSGLGLAITRRLVQMMGGEITAASEKGSGSTFTVRLPTP